MSDSIISQVSNKFLSFFEWIKILIPDSAIKKLSNTMHIYNRDIRHMIIGAKVVSRLKKYKQENVTVVKSFQKTMEKNPEKSCFLFEDRKWSFKDVDTYSNQICCLFGSFVEKGEVIALMMVNRPEYPAIWLGNAKAGIITALINTNVKMKPLLHCLNATNPKAIIYSKCYESALTEIINEIEGDVKYYCFDGESSLLNSQSLPEALSSVDLNNIPRRNIGFDDLILYIFTSGTTGTPKPAKVTNSKMMGFSILSDLMYRITDKDVLYSPMPMYHSSFSLGCSISMTQGVSMAVRSKFSASSFISDCRKYNATIAQYIGEMLRYVVNTPAKPDDMDHKLRFITGNGVRDDVWRKFTKRFNVKNIMEFYGSTEANFFLLNFYSKFPCCGYFPLGIPKWYLLGPSLIKVDQQTYEPIRNKDGLCILADPGEVGLCIGYCSPGNDMRKFHGYAVRKETEKKILTNVFKNGDSAFNTGDLLVMDETGWITFVDRVGDTFRWKGENVSTAEVESVLNEAPSIANCAVYGVKIGDLEGKAGMASVIMNDINELDNFNKYINLSLPTYAQPLIIRLVDSLKFTATFKVIKVDLVKEGFDLSIVTDPLLIRLDGKYTPLTKPLYESLMAGKLKI